MKFARLDRRYLDERKSFSDRYGPRELWSVMDHWPLYCGIANLGRSLAIADLLRSSLTVPGHVVEFGSWRGANLLFLAKLLRIFDPHGAKLVHCFESFEGLSTFVPEDGASAATRGKYKGSYQELLEVIALYDMQDEIIIHKGLVQEQLPAVLAQQTELTFSLCYCDVDLYEPTRIILDEIHPRLAQGGVFILDEWNTETFPGETLAVREFLRAHGGAYAMEHVKHARQPTLVLRKTAA
jgi:SAM-dependent methyltransferase